MLDKQQKDFKDRKNVKIIVLSLASLSLSTVTLVASTVGC